jgi:hypothetical protein
VIGEMFFVSSFAPIATENHIIKLFPICFRFGAENGKKISFWSFICVQNNEMHSIALVLSIKI